jgi:hypothetical protein
MYFFFDLKKNVPKYDLKSLYDNPFGSRVSDPKSSESLESRFSGVITTFLFLWAEGAGFFCDGAGTGGGFDAFFFVAPAVAGGSGRLEEEAMTGGIDAGGLGSRGAGAGTTGGIFDAGGFGRGGAGAGAGAGFFLSSSLNGSHRIFSLAQ